MSQVEETHHKFETLEVEQVEQVKIYLLLKDLNRLKPFETPLVSCYLAQLIAIQHESVIAKGRPLVVPLGSMSKRTSNSQQSRPSVTEGVFSVSLFNCDFFAQKM